MNKDVREVLDRIQTVLVKYDNSAVQLWNILTALRGPDDLDVQAVDAKELTKEVRRAAFPLITRNEVADFYMMEGYERGKVMQAVQEVRTTPGIPPSAGRPLWNKGVSHFYRHIQMAFEAIDAPE